VEVNVDVNQHVKNKAKAINGQLPKDKDAVKVEGLPPVLKTIPVAPAPAKHAARASM